MEYNKCYNGMELLSAKAWYVGWNLSDTAKGAALTGSHRNGNNLGSEGFNVIVSDLSGHNNLRLIVILAEVSLG